ncbi:MAG: acetate--CoA ligase family protein [Deltaproteobacteria bacterium]|nr:acetate--CoA ligase family protein [Deltaproteobacteria bacterium]
MGTYSLEELERYFSPHHIAVIGATPNNQWFGNIVANAVEAGFTGRFYPVNPRAEEIYGVRAFPNIDELPAEVDFAVLIVKSSLVPDAVRKLNNRGVKHVLLVSSGFAEVGEEGRNSQVQLRRYCRDEGIILMGPNCLGFVNPAKKVSVFSGRAVEGAPFSGHVAVVGQSGATSEVIATKILKKGLGISLYVTTGNEALLTAEDCMEYLVHDDRTRVITAFIEEFRNVRKLKEVASRAAEERIPIIILKIGSSAKGKKAAASHTGALAGNDRIIDGLCRQLGIIRVETIEELVETTALFSRVPRLPAGPGLGICTFSGGLCGLYADLCDRYGIALPPLEEKTLSRLKELLPAFALPDNPLDVTGSGFLGGMKEIVQSMVEDGNLDLIVPICIPPQNEEDFFAPIINDSFLKILPTVKKPVVPITFREMTDYARRYFNEKGLFYIESPDVGFRALAHFIGYGVFLKRSAEGNGS